MQFREKAQERARRQVFEQRVVLGTEADAAEDVEQLQMRGDALSQVFEALRARDAQAYEEASAAVVAAGPPTDADRSRPVRPAACA